LYIDPLSAIQLKTALERSNNRETIPLSFLHAVCSTPDLRSLYLRGSDSWVEEKAEHIQHSLLLDVPSPSSDEYEWFLSDLKTAFLLEDWIEEKPFDALVLKYNIWPGDVYTVVELAEWLLHATREFARMYNFSCVSDINDLLIRVQNGCKEELLNLVSLKGIGRVRARALYREGFKTVNDLRNVPLERIAKIKAIGKAVATNIKQQIGEGGQKGNKELRGSRR
jgi:helicase